MATHSGFEMNRKFTLFSNLPAEIRFMIYRHAVTRENGMFNMTIEKRARLPAIARVCKEAEDVVSQHFWVNTTFVVPSAWWYLGYGQAFIATYFPKNVAAQVKMVLTWTKRPDLPSPFRTRCHLHLGKDLSYLTCLLNPSLGLESFSELFQVVWQKAQCLSYFRDEKLIDRFREIMLRPPNALITSTTLNYDPRLDNEKFRSRLEEATADLVKSVRAGKKEIQSSIQDFEALMLDLATAPTMRSTAQSK